MKKILTFEQFASNRAATTNEDAIKAGEESEVVIDDMITTTVLKSLLKNF